MAIEKMEHVGIIVRDVAKSAAFYRDALGMELQFEYRGESGRPNLAFLGFAKRDNRQIIELIAGDPESLAEAGRVNHLAFTVADVDAETAKLRALGVRFMKPEPTHLPGLGRFIFFYGPDGEHLELMQRE